MRISDAVRLKLHSHRAFERGLVPNDAAAHLDHRGGKRSIRRRLHEDAQFNIFGGRGWMRCAEQDT